MHSNCLLLLYIINSLGELSGKNHFDAEVYNNRFKVRRLIKFKLDLCKEVHLSKKPEDITMTKGTLKKYLK